MNYLSKPIVFQTLFVGFLGAFISIVLSLFLPSESFVQKSVDSDMSRSGFSVARAFNIEVVKKVVKKVVPKKVSGEFLLRAFTINTIFLNDDKSLVIVKNSKGGVFLKIGDSYKKYELVEVYIKKARFKKGINFYWAFLDPKDEKNFQESKVSANKGDSIITDITKTAARPMFEEIIYKNGKYYIPRDKFGSQRDMMRHLNSAGAKFHNRKGVISFYINYLASNSIFRKIGIKKGDLIVGANGRNFKSIHEPAKFLQNIDNVKSVSITIERHKQTKELKYEIY